MLQYNVANCFNFHTADCFNFYGYTVLIVQSGYVGLSGDYEAKRVSEAERERKERKVRAKRSTSE